MEYAVVNPDGTIQNVILLEDVNAWTPPENTQIIPLVPNVGMAHTWDGTNFIAPPVVEVVENVTPQEAPNVIG